MIRDIEYQIRLRNNQRVREWKDENNVQVRFIKMKSIQIIMIMKNRLSMVITDCGLKLRIGNFKNTKN